MVQLAVAGIGPVVELLHAALALAQQRVAHLATLRRAPPVDDLVLRHGHEPSRVERGLVAVTHREGGGVEDVRDHVIGLRFTEPGTCVGVDAVHLGAKDRFESRDDVGAASVCPGSLIDEHNLFNDRQPIVLSRFGITATGSSGADR